MHWIDPDYLPEFTGTVDQFLVNKHGEADGFLLTDGEEVHVPPHLSARLLRDVRPGSQVKVRGVRPRGVQMVAAVAIDTQKGRILDEGPDVREDDDAFEQGQARPDERARHRQATIHGPKGETRGAVLEDGQLSSRGRGPDSTPMGSAKNPPTKKGRNGGRRRKHAHTKEKKTRWKGSAYVLFDKNPREGTPTDRTCSVDHC